MTVAGVAVLVLALVACERKDDGTMRLIDHDAAPPVIPAEEPPDSTRIAESSGYPALDSAALAGAAELRFSPALLQGRPVAAPFLQPVHFRSPRSRSTTE
jgi:outer membrane biosynthesis protein TonB